MDFVPELSDPVPACAHVSKFQFIKTASNSVYKLVKALTQTTGAKGNDALLEAQTSHHLLTIVGIFLTVSSGSTSSPLSRLLTGFTGSPC